jgi:ABC-type dipeptide/oligopeptide/nickel transport system ATPase component
MVETGTAEDVFDRPHEAYTRQLIEAIPTFKRNSVTLSAAAEG